MQCRRKMGMDKTPAPMKGLKALLAVKA